MLYSYQSVLPVNIEWDGAIRAALKGTAAEPIEFYTEFLDLAQFPDESYLQSLINLLQNKYTRQKIDLLIPMGDLAFHFLLAHRDFLFPGVPMVFCGAERNEVQALKKPKATTGVVTWIDVQGTLAAALKLHPQTRQIVLVGGTAETDRSFQRLAREALRPYEGRLEVIFLIDLPMDQILTKVANLPPNTIVLYLSLFRDSSGNDFVPRDALALVSQAANAPVYGLWETLLGHGIIGGHLVSLKAQGSMAGELGRRVLNGETPENIPIVYEGTDFYLFDWRQLQRWGIREGDLPPGSVVRFTEPSLWEEHQGAIIGISAAFCLLALLIVVLLINLGRRRRAERSLARRLKFETLLAELSAQFVAVSASEVDREIGQGIKQLVEFLGVDRGRLWRFSEDQAEFVSTHFWAAPGIEPMPLTPVNEHFPWIRSQLLNGRSIVLSQPDELPAEAQFDRQSLLASGITSILGIPLSVGGKFIGALTLSNLRVHKVWPPGLAQELQPIGEIFANALIRGQADNDLRQAELKYRIVADFTYDWEYWKNLDGTWRYVSPSCERISGYRPEEFIGRPDLIREIIVPEDRDRWDRHDCDSQEEPGAREIQFRLQRPDGAIRWIEHVCQPVTGDPGEFIGTRASNRDITARKQGELEIARLREQLQVDYSYLQEDIPLLIQSFVHRLSRKMGKKITKIPPQVLEALQQYPWPGNVRELENVIERALIDTRGAVLQLAGKINASLAPAPASPGQSLEAVERAHILQVLEEVRWKIDGKDGAAVKLELNPSTLRSRMRKLAIVRNQ